jgi:thiosulfate/3-mercaptopyruvate sulfurtransferase
MNARRLVALVILCIATIVFAKTSAPARRSLVVNTKWLAAHLDDPDLVLLHIGDKSDYESKHIRGARFVSLNDISISDHTGAGLMLEMPTAEELRQRLQKLGISDNSRIVAYYGKDWVSPTTRVIFTLDYAGLGDRTMLLDGGMPTWIREGQPTTDVVPPARNGKLSPLKIQQRVVDANFVRAHVGKPGYALIDGRAAVFYDGTDVGGSHDQEHRKGHITGARSFPFTEVTNDDLLLRSPEELRERFTKAGVKPGDTIVGYCHIGQQMTAVLFAARTLGHKVLLYDGSMEDWSKRRDFPVEY